MNDHSLKKQKKSRSGSETRQATERFSIRLCVEQKEKFLNNVKKSGFSSNASFFIHNCIDNPKEVETHSFRSEEMSKILGQIGHVGGNIYQLVRGQNLHYDIYDLKPLLEAYEEIKEVMRYLKIMLGMTPDNDHSSQNKKRIRSCSKRRQATESLFIRLRVKQKEKFLNNVKKSGFNSNTAFFIYNCIDNQKEVEGYTIRSEEMSKILGQIRHVGGNVYQLVRGQNLHYDIHKLKSLVEVAEEVKEVMRYLKIMLGMTPNNDNERRE